LFTDTTNLAPLLGVFLSDFYLGRYATLGLASVAYFLVMVLLKVTAIVSSLHARAVVAGSLMVAAVGVGVHGCVAGVVRARLPK
jgi:dipeptide/tripeptide permease